MFPGVAHLYNYSSLVGHLWFTMLGHLARSYGRQTFKASEIRYELLKSKIFKKSVTIFWNMGSDHISGNLPEIQNFREVGWISGRSRCEAHFGIQTQYLSEIFYFCNRHDPDQRQIIVGTSRNISSQLGLEIQSPPWNCEFQGGWLNFREVQVLIFGRHPRNWDRKKILYFS